MLHRCSMHASIAEKNGLPPGGGFYVDNGKALACVERIRGSIDLEEKRAGGKEAAPGRSPLSSILVTS